ncbi:MAG: GTP-binding protein [Algibacter sp.]
MPTTNDFVLRPRFKMALNKNNETVLHHFETTKTTQSAFIVTRLDDHVFIKFPKQEQHFWSPQLHLEINEVNKSSSMLHGLYGPNPTIWTMFMFFHFIIAGLFLAFGVWAYTNWSLKSSYAIQVALMLFMIIIWFALYFSGRIGKASSTGDMHKLQDFMNNVLNEKKV